ncbi:MAG: metallophosphoesterase [Candidatus Thorarchaeota archaeon]
MKFILTSDLHLRYTKPRCRIDDDWIETQRKQLEFIAQQSKDHESCPIVITGDIFHTPNVPDTIKHMLINTFFNCKVYILAGQHDLPYHKWEYVETSSFGLLWAIKDNFSPLIEFGVYSHWECDFINAKQTGLYFTHRPVFEGKVPPFMDNGINAQDFLDELPDAKWIFAGDHHRGFHYENNGQHVIVPGCLNRQASDFRDYVPVIWFVDTDKEVVEPIEVPDDKNMVVVDIFAKSSKERNKNISSIAERIDSGDEIELDFEKSVFCEDLKKLNEDAQNFIFDIFGHEKN